MERKGRQRRLFEGCPLAILPSVAMAEDGLGNPSVDFAFGVEEVGGAWVAGKMPRNPVPSALGRILVLRPDRLLISSWPLV